MGKKNSLAKSFDPTIPKELERTLEFHILHKIGVAIMSIVVILGLAKVFGVSSGHQTLTHENVEVSISYPTRFRFKQIHSIIIDIRNTSAEPLQQVEVLVDTDYLSSFSNLSTSPSPSQITASDYYFSLPEIESNQTQRIALEVQAEEFFAHKGTIEIRTGSSAPLLSEVSTFVFP